MTGVTKGLYIPRPLLQQRGFDSLALRLEDKSSESESQAWQTY